MLAIGVIVGARMTAPPRPPRAAARGERERGLRERPGAHACAVA